VNYIDANYRTIADRNHRATAGLSMGGFMSFWIAGKYPHLVSSASNFMGSSEFFVGPRGFDVEYRHDEMSGNYNGVRTRLVTGTKDFIQFYHRRMNAIWLFTAPNHETEDIEFDHGTPRMAKTLDFHMRAFANPCPSRRYGTTVTSILFSTCGAGALRRTAAARIHFATERFESRVPLDGARVAAKWACAVAGQAFDLDRSPLPSPQYPDRDCHPLARRQGAPDSDAGGCGRQANDRARRRGSGGRHLRRGRTSGDRLPCRE